MHWPSMLFGISIGVIAAIWWGVPRLMREASATDARLVRDELLQEQWRLRRCRRRTAARLKRLRRRPELSASRMRDLFRVRN